jgi:signal transduction histidine kinase
MTLSIAAAVLAGVVVRNKEEIFADTKARAERAEADRQAEAQRAVARERLRIAREMHDVVAHGMSLITVQAAAAQEIVRASPDEAARLMHSVEATGRDALAEMRRMLGVLRNDDRSGSTVQRGELAPQPSIADLNATVTHCREAGIPTELIISGEQRALPPGIELAAFRIVQEALTNVVKHGGDEATATVELRYNADMLGINISDTGRGAMSDLTRDGSGHGLIGMRERIEIYDGQLAAGPRPGGGYQVKVSLPIDAAWDRPGVISAEPEGTAPT